MTLLLHEKSYTFIFDKWVYLEILTLIKTLETSSSHKWTYFICVFVHPARPKSRGKSIQSFSKAVTEKNCLCFTIDQSKFIAK